MEYEAARQEQIVKKRFSFLGDMAVLQKFAQLGVLLVIVMVGVALPNPLESKEKNNSTVKQDLSHEMLNATLWQQSSAEYYGVTSQIYLLARLRLDEALVDKEWSAAIEQEGIDYQGLPPAIMLDIDETVLNNTCYEARLVRQYGQYSPNTFNEWVVESKQVPVPGVVQFLRYADKKGVAIFYFSGRTTDLKDGTVKSLRKIGVPLKNPEHYLLLNDGSSTSNRRSKIAKNYRILLLLGDNLDDFSLGSKDTPAARRVIAEKSRDRWGKHWIILPNAIYGHSEASHYGFDYSLPREGMLRKKWGALNECISSSRARD